MAALIEDCGSAAPPVWRRSFMFGSVATSCCAGVGTPSAEVSYQ